MDIGVGEVANFRDVWVVTVSVEVGGVSSGEEGGVSAEGAASEKGAFEFVEVIRGVCLLPMVRVERSQAILAVDVCFSGVAFSSPMGQSVESLTDIEMVAVYEAILVSVDPAVSRA